MSKKLSLGERLIGGPRKLVRDIISPNVHTAIVQKYRMGLQTYTFIVKRIKGVQKIIYIQNQGEDFFSKENVYDINYIKDLKVEFVKNYTKKEESKIRLREKTLQTKYI
jgi:hypothetical protein